MNPSTWNLTPAEVRAFWISLAANAVLALVLVLIVRRRSA